MVAQSLLTTDPSSLLFFTAKQELFVVPSCINYYVSSLDKHVKAQLIHSRCVAFFVFPTAFKWSRKSFFVCYYHLLSTWGPEASSSFYRFTCWKSCECCSPPPPPHVITAAGGSLTQRKPQKYPPLNHRPVLHQLPLPIFLSPASSTGFKSCPQALPP